MAVSARQGRLAALANWAFMRFGDFDFDENRWELKRAGKLLPVQRKALEVLAYLVKRSGSVVPAAELQRVVWGDTIVGDGSLRQALLQLRRALGDDAGRVIVNVRGVGYRVGVPVVEEGASSSARRGSFVGRASEMSSIEASLASVRSGVASVALVTGEPGIGKTRLAEEVARLARARDFHVVFARCSDEAGAPEFWPWVQVFRGPALQPDEDAPFGTGGGLPELVRSSESPSSLTPAQEQFRLFDAVRARLQAAATRAPLAVVFDDLHWADGSSLRLLRFVARSLRDARLFVLGTYRDAPIDLEGPSAEILDGISCIEGTRTYRLHGLGREEMELLLPGALPAGDRAREAARLCDWTGGNPLFLVHLLPRIEQGAVNGPGAQPLARGVRAAVAMLLSRVRPELRDLLLTAAVSGATFRVSLLAPSSRRAPAVVHEMLHEAAGAGLVRRRADDVFQFVHALLRDVLYADADPGERAARHRSLAVALESRAAPPGELAYHFGLSGPSGRAQAAKYARLAGRLALKHLAYDEAARHFEEALGWLSQEDPGSDAVLDVLLDLGSAQSAPGAITAARATFKEAARLARANRSGRRLAEVALKLAPGFLAVQTGVHDAYLVELLREARAVLGDSDDAEGDSSALRARLMGRLALALYSTPHQGEREKLGIQAVELARASGDAASLAYALVMRHGSAWSPDNLPERNEWVREALRLVRANEDPDTACVAHCFLIVAHLESGDVVSLDRELQAFREIAPRHGGARIYATAYGAMRAHMDGRFDDVERIAHEYLVLAERIDDHNARQGYGAHITLCRVEQGRAAEVVEPVLAYARQYVAVPGWRALAAFVAACAGDHDRACRELEICARDDFAGMPRDHVWLCAMAFAANAAGMLGHARIAEIVYRLLAPCAARYVVIGMGVASLGSVEFYLGVLSGTLSRSPLDEWHQRSRSHLTTSIERNRPAGLRIYTAWSEAELGLLLAREPPSDSNAALRARELLAGAGDTAQALGMTRLLDRLSAGRLQRSREDPLRASRDPLENRSD